MRATRDMFDHRSRLLFRLTAAVNVAQFSHSARRDLKNSVPLMTRNLTEIHGLSSDAHLLVRS